MRFCDRDMNGAISLSEYVFVRKGASAWRQCVSSNRMNYKDLQCALRYTSDGANVTEGEARTLFYEALQWMERGSQLLTLPVFIRLAQYHRLFTT